MIKHIRVSKWVPKQTGNISYCGGKSVSLVLFKHFRERLQEKWEGIVQHLDEVPTAALDTMYIMYNSGNGK